MVVINREDFLVKRDNTLGNKPSRFFSKAICNLLLDIKAISIPEKKAERAMDMSIVTSVDIIYLLIIVSTIEFTLKKEHYKT